MPEQRDYAPAYPQESLSEHSELEQILFSAPKTTNPLRFNNLPQTLYSGAIEAYANWIGETHFSSNFDQERHERVRLDNLNGFKPSFPRYLKIGSQGGGVDFVPFEDEDWLSFTPAVDVHSHSGLPIQSEEDMEIFLDHLDYVVSNKGMSPKIASIVAGRQFNYMFVSTNDSNPSNWRQSRKDINLLRDEVDQAHEFFQQDLAFFALSLRGEGFPEEDVIEAIRRAEKDTFKGHTHLDTFLGKFMNAEMARRNNVGFYISAKNGEYYLRGEGLPGDTDRTFRARLDAIYRMYGITDVPYADFLSRMDKRLATDVVTRSRARSVGLFLPERKLLI